ARSSLCHRNLFAYRAIRAGDGPHVRLLRRASGGTTDSRLSPSRLSISRIVPVFSRPPDSPGPSPGAPRLDNRRAAPLSSALAVPYPDRASRSASTPAARLPTRRHERGHGRGRRRFPGEGGRMKPAAFEYVAVRTTEEALAELARDGQDARLLAGGQS